MITRCKQCNLPFHPLTKKVKYCKKCRRKGIRYYELNKVEQKTCPTCKKKFKTNKTSKVYCSDKCRDGADKRRKPKVKKVCDWCGKAFETSRPQQRFCENKCYRLNKAKEAKSGN